MKNLILTLILPFFGLGILSYEDQNDLLLQIAGYLLVFLGLLSLGFIGYNYYKYRLTAEYAIKKNTLALENQINKNQKDIEKLRKKFEGTRQELRLAGAINENIRQVTESNLQLWKDQIGIHEDLIGFCQLRINYLAQSKKELELLNHLVREMKSEPNVEERIKKLEGLMSDIDYKVRANIDSTINKLIDELKNNTRREKLILLKDKVKNMKRTIT